MIQISTNIIVKVAGTKQQIERVKDTDKLLRTCATTVLSMMKQRIHVQGRDAKGAQIGIYSPAYMKVRTGMFGNADRVKKGAKVGLMKNAGVFTRGKNVGGARPRYNRKNDTKVILSLTRQMENDEKVLAVGKGYGIGFSNAWNFQKAQWNEQRYMRPGGIFKLSKEEVAVVNTLIQNHVNNALSGQDS